MNNKELKVGDRVILTFRARGYSAYHGGRRRAVVVGTDDKWNSVVFDDCNNERCKERGLCNDYNASSHVFDLDITNNKEHKNNVAALNKWMNNE